MAHQATQGKPGSASLPTLHHITIPHQWLTKLLKKARQRLSADGAPDVSSFLAEDTIFKLFNLPVIR